MSNEEQMRKEFEAWFIKNYPADTIIAVPEWHAPKIYQAATASKQQEIDKLAGELAIVKGREEFDCQRLRNVARLLGLESALPETDYVLHGSVGTVCGMFYRKIGELNKQLLEQAAQVEKMRKAVSFAVEDLLLRAGLAGEDCLDISQSALDGLNAIASLAPSTALAEHDNEVAAKALEYEATQLDDWHHSVAGYLRDRATERRSGK